MSHNWKNPCNWKDPVKRGRNISKSLTGRKLSPEHRLKAIKTLRKCRYSMLGKHHSVKTKKVLSDKNMGNKKYLIGFNRIEVEAKKLEQQGFRVIPITRAVPDIIAIKDGKVFAIEVEYSNHPNYSKYTDDVRKYYDDIVWILKHG